jgi:FKBP-type peptidyl-prolyl cis-trans isomerase
MLASATTNAPVARPRTRVLRARTASSGVAHRARVGVARASTSRDDERDDERASASARATTSARRREMTLASLALAMAAAASATTTNAARAASDAGDWSSPGLASSGPAAKYVKTPSGLVYEDVNEGIGEPARAGDVAVFEYVMRRANGYFIYGTVDCGIGCGNGDPFEAKLGPDGNLIAGLDELLTGMKPGAKRKALIKADLGYKDDPKLSRFAPRPPEFGQQRQIIRLSANDEPMVFEVKLVKTRANSR